MKVVPKVSNIYRRLRICEDNERLLNQYEQIKKASGALTIQEFIEKCESAEGGAKPECKLARHLILIYSNDVNKMLLEKDACPKDAISIAQEAPRGSKGYLEKLTELQKRDCPDNARGAACTEAKRILKTWEVDFRWTEAQHRVGAEFAIQHCKKKPPTSRSGDDPSDKTCPILEPSNSEQTTEKRAVQ